MVKDAEAHAKEDAERRKAIETRNQLDSLVYQTEKTLREQRDNLPAADISAVESAVNEGREALKGEDVAVMERARDQINEAAHKLAEAMYKHAAGSQAEGGERQEQAGAASGAHKRVRADAEAEIA